MSLEGIVLLVVVSVWCGMVVGFFFEKPLLKAMHKKHAQIDSELN